MLKIRGPPRSTVNRFQLRAFGLFRSNVRSDKWFLGLGWTRNVFEWSMFVQQRWQCGCKSFKVRMQCGDRNFENLRGKNIIAKIWYVDGFDGSNTFSNSWSPGLLWDRHSRQYCMMVRNEWHWTLDSADHFRGSSSNQKIKSVTCPVSRKGNVLWQAKMIQNWKKRGSRWWCRVINMKVKITCDDKFRGRWNKTLNERSEFLHENRCARGWGSVNCYEFENRWGNWNLYA